MFTLIKNIIPGDVITNHPEIGDRRTVLTVAKIVDWAGGITGYIIKYTDNTQEEFWGYQQLYVEGHDSRVDDLLDSIHPYTQDHNRIYQGD